MDFRGTKLEDIVVKLPFADGTSADYGVHKYFQFDGKEYFAMLPLIGKKQLDYDQKPALYEVQEDAEQNPVVIYIEDDGEYERAANFYLTLK